jgi:hypothetical protein
VSYFEDIEIQLDTGATINISGNDLTAEDMTKLQSVIGSLNPTNLGEVQTQLTEAGE